MSIRVTVSALVVEAGKILLIKFADESGVHFNLPGGGVDLGESLVGALARECREEACVEIEVGRLIGAWEYVPELHERKFGPRQKLGLVFLCRLRAGSVPALPDKPDPNQVGVEWLELAALEGLAPSRRPPIFPQIEPELLAALKENAPAFFVSRV